MQERPEVLVYHKTKMGRVSKVWKCGGIIGTLNYLFAIQTIRIVWTEQHYPVFLFSPFSKPKYIQYSVFSVFSDPEYIWYSVKISIRPNTATDWKASRVDACSQAIKIHVQKHRLEQRLDPTVLSYSWLA